MNSGIPYEKHRSANLKSGSHRFLQNSSNGTSLPTQSYPNIATSMYIAYRLDTSISAMTHAVVPPKIVRSTPGTSSGIEDSTSTTWLGQAQAQGAQKSAHIEGTGETDARCA